MIAAANPVPPSEGGDPPCWSHLLEDTRGDVVDRIDIELLVRNFFRDAAMERLLSGVSASGSAPIEPMWRRVDGI